MDWVSLSEPESFNQTTTPSGQNAAGLDLRTPPEPCQDSQRRPAIHDADADAEEPGGEGQPLIDRREAFP